jgi:mannose-6-phosphate isomerase-like protein (cupin superfamily)
MLVIHESQISLTVWDKWLYRRLVACPDMVVGQCFLNAGRSQPHTSGSETQTFFVNEGAGRVYSHSVAVSGDRGGDANRSTLAPLSRLVSVYAPALLFSIEPHTAYEFECRLPTELFVIRCGTGIIPRISLDVLAIGQRRPYARGQLPLRSRENDVLIMVSGEAAARAGGQSLNMRQGHVVRLPVEGDLTLENVGATECSIIHATVRNLSVQPSDSGIAQVR